MRSFLPELLLLTLIAASTEDSRRMQWTGAINKFITNICNTIKFEVYCANCPIKI